MQIVSILQSSTGQVADVDGAQPLLSVQNSLPRRQIPIGTGLLVFFQFFGGTIFLTLGELIFSHGLEIGLNKYAPDVSASVVVAAGATGFRDKIASKDIAGVIQAYVLAIDNVFYLAAGSSAVTFLFCWGMSWRRAPEEKATTSSA